MEKLKTAEQEEQDREKEYYTTRQAYRELAKEKAEVDTRYQKALHDFRRALANFRQEEQLMLLGKVIVKAKTK